jgi:type 1 fimbria pilin
LNVHLTLTDATAPANRSAVLTLKAEATARGVGLQVRRPDGTPVHYGAPSEEVGNPNQWLVGSVAQGVPVFSIPLTAHYIQTEPRVVPGSVGARAIFTLAYD